ncbi:unnamed protein product [Kuraishia capsulata CBS 1993]|uniref:USP domain-containing protein n=1 Tax=Kuraishia capsulata CBS 1993 TaxID=1382522 RepID=W6MXB5_9ASCO|nr:uncharacterized protein KUCA_T00004584001 [Kuraishia capsulata CBS 1993]CDK28600.1 unnamed protein product [Kuraishia capsulata CBS 1993]
MPVTALTNRKTVEDYPGMPIYQKESDSGKEELISQWSRIPTYRASTGLRGFVNMGATCFMSSILQTMVHNPFIRDYYMSGEHFDCDKELGECIACCVGEIFSEFYTSNKTNGYGPTALLTAAWKVKRSLAGYSEQDAHEFWQFTLDELHKAHVAMNEDKIELSKRQKKNSSPHAMLLDCSCVTHKTFAGELQSSIMCTKCSSLTLTADPMLDLSLEISKKEDDNNNLISCLDKFTNIESLDMMYNCDTCGKRTPATKKLTIKRLSPVLAIQLKRFEHFSATTSKIDTHVKFPLMLDVAKYTLDGSNITGDKTYELFAVVCHIGSVNTGHYICYVKSREGKWFKFDDAVVTLVPSEEVLKVRAYLLYYIIHRLP